MSDIISKLKSPEECATLEKNALDRGKTELAVQARKRGIELRALAHGATNQAERECLEAIYAYEHVMTKKRHRTFRASRTWPMIKQHGIKGAVERAVNRPTDASGYVALVEMGLEQFAFEAVILRHPQDFSPAAVEHSRQRMTQTYAPNKSPEPTPVGAGSSASRSTP